MAVVESAGGGYISVWGLLLLGCEFGYRGYLRERFLP